ncbi:MAG: hypothetical protein IKW81_03190 [Pseudobutyrivibrio sp.]|nr:hypothetical protein [Pseudobutyrivibrio sp.]
MEKIIQLIDYLQKNDYSDDAKRVQQILEELNGTDKMQIFIERPWEIDGVEVLDCSKLK